MGRFLRCYHLSRLRKLIKVAERIKHQGKSNPYLCSVDGTKKAEIAKYALHHGNLAAVRHFGKDFPEPNTLKESTIRGWKGMKWARERAKVEKK